MASSDSSSALNGGQVIVILAARAPGPQFVEPERRLTFTRQNPTIAIGRASKVSSKGFVAAADNAWFDSPVMSREHAELSVDFDKTPKAVYIKDVNSLHGTFHKRGDGLGNETKLAQGHLTKLESGDILRFGIDIYRHNETFPPCYVDFLIQEETMESHNPSQQNRSEAASTRCFSVCVPGDDLDDEDLLSEDDSVIETGMLLPQQYKRRPPTPFYEGASGSSVIDLTQNDFDPPSSQNVGSTHVQSSVTAQNVMRSDFIDLTSEPEHNDEPRTDPVPCQSTASPHTHRQSSEPVGSISVSSFVPEQVVSEVPRLELRPVIAAEPAASIVADDNAEPQAPENISQTQDGPSSTKCNDVGEPSVASESESPGLGSEEVDINLTDSEDESLIAEESADDSSSQDSDMEEDSPISEIDEEYGVSREMEYEIEYHDDDDDEGMGSTSLNLSQSSSEELEDSVFRDQDSAHLDSMPSSPIAAEPNKPMCELAATSASGGARHTEESVITRPRAPSPSDAAMAKALPFGPPCHTHTALALGAKTGKYEYFAAREGNKAAFTSAHLSPAASAIRDTLVGSKDAHEAPTQRAPAMYSFTPGVKPSTPNKTGATNLSDLSQTASSRKLMDPALLNHEATAYQRALIMHGSAWSASGDMFINSPVSGFSASPTQRTRLQSPELDMTSAYTFHRSKLAVENKTDQSVKRVQIQDLLAQEPEQEQMEEDVVPIAVESPATPSNVSKTAVGSKRSFDDAFTESDGVADVGVDGHRIHYGDQSVSPDSDTASSKDQEPQLSASPVVQEPDAIPVPAEELLDEPTQQTIVRPAKRRRFAEVAACVALGGAGVLSALIMSAPSFA
ncbi:hypothetical protein DL764_002569 [Monosporascus ibericus]|uniref:FHA domain-containing protein n=1 Tax=Monosporascus ibericus TaxID=155417 RepID=A0A4Q4TPM4_9PEZI|nr:hypothetical protein DL764_002569 [Monosporascus ibericus]